MGSVASIGSYEVNGVNGVSGVNGLLGSYGVMGIIRIFGIGGVSGVMRGHWGQWGHVGSLGSVELWSSCEVTGVTGSKKSMGSVGPSRQGQNSSVLGPQHSMARRCSDAGAAFPPGHPHAAILLQVSAGFVASCWGAPHLLLQLPPNVTTASSGAVLADASAFMSLDFLPPISSCSFIQTAIPSTSSTSRAARQRWETWD